MLPLNIQKCVVLHLGNNNPRTAYHIGNHQIKPVRQYSDLGIMITSNLSWSSQTCMAAQKANSALFLIMKAFPHPDSQTAVKLYVTYVRPHLEYLVPLWSSLLVKDKVLLEKIQRRATRWALGSKDTPYEERLAVLKLPKLDARRNRADLIQLFRLVRGFFPI